MATSKPLVKAYFDQKTKSKIEYICKKDKRSVSNLLELLAEKHIEEYENHHGELIIEEDGTVHPKPKRERSSNLKSG